MLLVLVDAKLKWLEVAIVSSATSKQTANHLRDVFARFGLPWCIVTDNRTPFASQLFQDFVQGNEWIKHLRTAPFHPTSNGSAVCAVRSVKEGLKKTEGATSSSEFPSGCSCTAVLDLCIPGNGKEVTSQQLQTEPEQHSKKMENESCYNKGGSLQF